MLDNEITVLLTGFGPFLDVKSNPSSLLLSHLPSSLPNTYPPVRLIVPPSPLKAIYADIAVSVSTLVTEHNPDLVIHIGLDVDRSFFAVERGALRDGYHDIPDESRRVFTRAENKAAWGKSPERLGSDLPLDDLLPAWKRYAPKGEDVRVTDDVGNYVCGFVYYASLERCRKEAKRKDVIFLHVPKLDMQAENDVKRGVAVIEGLVRATVESVDWE